MFGDLSHFTDNELLNFIGLILSKPDEVISARDYTELDQINTEFIRRGHADLQTVK